MPRLTNAAVAEKATEYKALKAEISTLEERAGELTAELLAALRSRRTQRLELPGLVITRKAPSRKLYSIAKLKAAVSRSVFARVCPPTVVAAELKAAVKAGDVDQAVIDGCLIGTDEFAPYVDVRFTAATS